ncbi:MAG TPA: TIGR03118 family protein, partial [Anaeromyxobacteraceae bacterium]
APFGIMIHGDTVYVTYAKQDAARHDDVKGPHLGFVSAFGLDGTFLRRVASRGKLDAPWGLALAPADFGQASGRLLVGNFGDGHIVSFRLAGEGDDDGGNGNGAYLTGPGGRLHVDGLWALAFGNGAVAGPTNVLFFTAGPAGETHGLFGRIDLAPHPGDRD